MVAVEFKIDAFRCRLASTIDLLADVNSECLKEATEEALLLRGEKGVKDGFYKFTGGDDMLDLEQIRILAF